MVQKSMKRALSAAACAAIACGLASGQGAAQQFPSGPIRIVGANPAGGAADVNARRLADRLSKKWGQPVVVQNLAGAGGSVAASTVANATPNGHTILFAFHPMLAVNPILYADLPFDADKDFASVIFISKTPHVLLVNPSLPAKNVSELLALAKAKPGTFNFGSGGAGSSTHLAGELLKARSGVDLKHVPYRGGAPAAAALMGNEIQILFDATLTAVGHIKGGRLKGLAIASPTRAQAIPEVPTFAESGVPNFESTIGHGLVVPAKTPAAAINALNKAANEAIKEPEYFNSMNSSGAQVIGGAPKQFRDFLDAERRKWTPIIKQHGIKAG
jgi:tripartite-type tricarboxylate transporter receptor subunit TctC